MSVLIKRYANRKLYDTQASRYITLKGISELIRAGQDVRVIDNESGEDITNLTLSQILVDGEREGRPVPRSMLSDLVQRGGGALYGALRKGAHDASESLEELQRNVRKLLEPTDVEKLRERIAFAPPDIEQLVQNAVHRVLELLDLPSRSDLAALERKLDRLLERDARRGSERSDPPAPPAD